jgi:hypothetical protein
MYDATHQLVGNIPHNAPIIGYYVDGASWCKWTAADLALFPLSEKVPITVTGANLALVIDCEKGDVTPTQAANWAKFWVDNHARPTIYCNASTRPEVVAALAAQGLMFVRDVDCWLADYDNIPVIPAGCVAKQYQSTSKYDLSVTNNVWPMNPPVQTGVAMKLNWHLDGNVADIIVYPPTGGIILVTPDGSIWNDNSPYFGGANGKAFFAGRTAAELKFRPATGPGSVAPYGVGYQIIDTAGEVYNFDQGTAPK